MVIRVTPIRKKKLRSLETRRGQLGCYLNTRGTTMAEAERERMQA
jgi:hypothetical protein